jgi:hypothetical protein
VLLTKTVVPHRYRQTAGRNKVQRNFRDDSRSDGTVRPKPHGESQERAGCINSVLHSPEWKCHFSCLALQQSARVCKLSCEVLLSTHENSCHLGTDSAGWMPVVRTKGYRLDSQFDHNRRHFSVYFVTCAGFCVRGVTRTNRVWQNQFSNRPCKGLLGWDALI